ncbi:hypothetical protein RCL_jg4447.t1 [Rhizophagus clarus]|uniref:Uncharacterized protein n=1 Tax=Rhizophagus clarus TaxID=94130 RepID=A0A8H3KSK5_9GLOM|nr:hypothetical protein RCL_jg4447.t1 [Rhizophagus clarus]
MSMDYFDYYKHRQKKADFTRSFRREADELMRCLTLLVNNKLEKFRMGATRLLSRFEGNMRISRIGNEQVDRERFREINKYMTPTKESPRDITPTLPRQISDSEESFDGEESEIEMSENTLK